uniref:Uncharacterized protein n=1 Tax=Echinococcus granulosus TaxID=6210 RepID=U6FQN1_ECHGR|nr:hypothetical protein EgrG_000947900 [Echinococcus granulosus]
MTRLVSSPVCQQFRWCSVLQNDSEFPFLTSASYVGGVECI